MRPGLKARRGRIFLLLWIGLAAVGLWAGYRWDNKYTHPAPAAGDGVMSLAGMPEDEPVFLVQGWEFYQYRWLTPEEARAARPDAIVFIGQYAGYDMGDPEAAPRGEGTYRITLTLDDAPRDYALELSEIFSSYELWINGESRRTQSGMDTSVVHFTAAGQAELVIATADATSFYNGMVYPPAFGSSQAVSRLHVLRLTIRSAVVAVSLLIGLISLALVLGRTGLSYAPQLSVMGFAHAAYTAYPLMHLPGAGSTLGYDIEHMGYYALLFALVWLQGRLLGLPKALYRSVMALSGLVCLLQPVIYRIQADRAGDLYAVSSALSIYLWAVSLYLIISTLLSFGKNPRHGYALLAGFCVFGMSLVFDRLYPWFEPILLGRHNETAGFLLVLTVAGLLCRDLLGAERERRALRERNRAAALILDGQQERIQLQQRQLGETGKLVHEMRSKAFSLLSQMEKENYETVRAQLAALAAFHPGASPPQYCRHELMNALLYASVLKAQRAGIRLEVSAEGLGEELFIDDHDLSSLVLNLLGNAIDAVSCLEEGDRWISFSAKGYRGHLILACRNPFDPGAVPQRDDAYRHGFGQQIMREVAARYKGYASFGGQDGIYTAEIGIYVKIPAASG